MRRLLVSALVILAMFWPQRSNATVEEGPSGLLLATLIADGALMATGAVLDGLVIADLAQNDPSGSPMRWATGLVGGVNLLGGTMMVVLSQEVSDDEEAGVIVLGAFQLAFAVGGIVLSIVADDQPAETPVMLPYLAPEPHGWRAGVSMTVVRW